MAVKIFVLVACIALTQGAIVRRDAPTPDLFKDMTKHAEEVRKTFETNFNEFSKSKETQEFKKALGDGANVFSQQLEAFTKSMQSVLTDVNGKAKELMEQSKQNIEKMTEDLRKAHPDVEKNAAGFSEKMQSTMTSVFQETEKMAKHLGENISETNAELAPKLKAAFDDLAKNVDEVGKKLQEAVKPKQ